RRLVAIPGVGPVTATAVIAAIGNGAAFRKGREFAAWLGVVRRAFHHGPESCAPLKAEYICADQPVSFIFRLRHGGGPYIPVCKETGISQPLRVSQCRSDRGATSFLVSRSLYCGGNDSHPPPSALYKAIRFVVTAVWLC